MSTGGWQPREGARVRVTADPRAAADEAPPPPGTWMVLARSPEGPTFWWLLAVDPDSRWWCETHPGEVVNRCIARPNRRLAPINSIRI